MKILVLGGRGRLAATLASTWNASHEVATLSRPEIDVADARGLRSTLEAADFDVLVNGTGLTNVDACESRREEALAVNSRAPGVMAEVARERRARFIHFSTDYVFDGLKQAPYVEEDPPSPLGWYGRTKLGGEEAVLASSPSHLVVRVSWVFGPGKPAFPELLVGRARESSHVEAIADKFSCPTSARDVASWLLPFLVSPLPGGIYHACNSGGCSWRDYGAAALACAVEAGVPLATSEVVSISLRDMKAFKAPRPVHTILSTEKLARAIGCRPRPWQEALREHLLSLYAPLPSAS